VPGDIGMNIELLLVYLREPIVLYAIALTAIWVLIQAINNFYRGNWNAVIQKRDVPARIPMAIVLIYTVFTLMFVCLNKIALFPILHAVTLGIILLMLPLLKPKRTASVGLLCTILVAIMPVLIVISTRHPYPLGDDARFIGFAAAIDNDGRWIPYKYSENLYYQFFHLIPFLELVLASITGVGVLNVISYYLTLKISLYLAYLLLTYLVVREITKDHTIAYIGVLLLSITPPLALTQVVHQGYAIVLFLAVALLLLKLNNTTTVSTGILLASIVLSIAGIIAHATYTTMIVTFTLPMFFTLSQQSDRRILFGFLRLIIVISLVYWVSTYVLDVIVRPGVSAVERLVDLFTGRTILLHGTSKPWYTARTESFLIAWALLPSIVGAYLLTNLLKLKYERRFLTTLGAIGLIGTGINYLLRFLSYIGGRYFYWLYLLMLPLGAFVVKNSSRKIILGLIFSVITISLVSFYGVQNPNLAANTYGDYIGWADRTSWEVAKGLAPYINPETRTWLDPRIGAPISSLTSPPSLGEDLSADQVVAIISEDSIGLHAMNKDPRNVDFFKRYFDTDPNHIFDNLDNLNIIFRCGSYYGIAKP